MNLSAAREHLARLISDETALLAALEAQLKTEHGLLTANDVDGLDDASSRRQASVAQLLRLDDERRGLCRSLKYTEDMAGVSALLKCCDPQGTLSEAYSRCATQAQHCRDQNDRNGALVSARLNRVSNMLGMLNAGSSSTPVYNAHATRQSGTASAGRLLTTQA
jgi:flagellar biosynthesis protein FlgN